MLTNSNRTQQRELNKQQDHKKAPITSIEHNMEAMTNNKSVMQEGSNDNKHKRLIKEKNNP